jgi:hypothetical protein
MQSLPGSDVGTLTLCQQEQSEPLTDFMERQ